MAEIVDRIGYHRWAHDIDAEAARQLNGGRQNEAVKTAADDPATGNSGPCLVGEYTTGQGERAIGREIALAHQH